MDYQARNSEFSLTPAQLQELIESAPSLRDSLVIKLFVFTAIRRAELRMLTKRDLDIRHHRVLVRRGKGGKQRILYLPETLTYTLNNYSKKLRSLYLFPGRGGRPMSLRNINYIVSKAGRLAALKNPNPRYGNITPHLLRHSFARNWKRAGGSLESLQRILGHSSLKTTMDIYGTESQHETEENYHRMVGQLAFNIAHS